MNLLWPSQWGITARLVMVACVPALMMSLVITIALYVSGQDEALEAVREKGALVASSLAQTAQYGLVSGNAASLERSIHRLVDPDPSIVSIQVRDSEGHVVAEAMDETRRAKFSFERDVRADVFPLDLLDNSGSGEEEDMRRATGRNGPVIGKVIVRMSSDTIVQQRLRRIVYGAFAVMLVAVMSALAGLTLAQRLREPLRAVMVALREIRQGHFEVTLPAGASGELGELQSTIHEMAQGLVTRREELQALVDTRTADLQAAMERARIADAERRRLLARSNQQLEDERKRIGVEIHDQLNASLIGLRSKAEHIAEVSSNLDDPVAREVHTTASQITSTIADLYKSARTLVKQLRPQVIDVLGLKGALQEMVREYNQHVPRIRFALDVPADFPAMQGQVAIVAYRLVQEALSNAVKHSAAHKVAISVQTWAQKDEVLIVVVDDGIGFDPVHVPSDKLGLAGMRERIAIVGGGMKIQSTPNRGTRVTFQLPQTDPEHP